MSNWFIYDVDYVHGNCHIEDSWRITRRCDMRVFVQENLTKSPFNCRSINSYIREWRAHNLLFIWNVKSTQTRDVDLDINESKLRRLGYFFLSFLYNFYNK